VRKRRMMGAILAGVLLVGRAAAAQTPGPFVEPASRGIIPVTGPSTVPALPEPAKPEVIPAVARGEVANVEGAPKSTGGRTPAATAARPAPRSAKAVKTVPKPAGKTPAKRASAARHVAKATGSQKTRHVVAAAKHQPPAHHAAVSKPIPVTKHQAPTKGAPPVQPVLPRV
jgi:hypothetical protein